MAAAQIITGTTPHAAASTLVLPLLLASHQRTAAEQATPGIPIPATVNQIR